jgi:hypothetical protein
MHYLCGSDVLIKRHTSRGRSVNLDIGVQGRCIHGGYDDTEVRLAGRAPMQEMERDGHNG